MCTFRLIGKDSDAGREWGQEEKGTTEDDTEGDSSTFKKQLYGCGPYVALSPVTGLHS